MKRIATYIVITLSTMLWATGQLPYTPKSALSPNAASLGEYGNIPVSLYTGRQVVSIPLHEIKVGNHRLPITLNYNGGGVRPDQHPGWVGMDWVLQAGGCIMREVNSWIDEYNNPIRTTQAYNNCGYLYIRDAQRPPLPHSNRDSLQNYLYIASHNATIMDISPDKFSFNFLDYSGNFYLSPDSGWIVQCDRPIKIMLEYNEDGSLSDENFTRYYAETTETFSLKNTNAQDVGRSHSFKKFTLIGEDGTKYIFGEDDNAIEYSIDLYNQQKDHLIANTWHLKRIIYPDNHTITFEYERGDFIVQMYINSYYKFLNVEYDNDIFQRRCGNSFAPVSYYAGQLIMPSYLSKIVYDYGYLDFIKNNTTELTYDLYLYSGPYAAEYKKDNQSDNAANMMPILANNGDFLPQYANNPSYPECLSGIRWKQLSKIMEYAVDTTNCNILVNQINFNYTDTTTQRLTLESVEIGAHTNAPNDKLTYSFEYKRPDLLPGYLSKQVDHWGYFNGTVASNILAENYAESRDPNPAIADIGALTKITYPTGGYTRFEYEPHDYISQVTEERDGIEELTSKKYAGGIRIKRIIQSATGTPGDEYVDKEYFYVTDFLSNGINATTSSGTLTQRYKYNHLNKILYATNYSGATFSIDAYGSQSFLPSLGNTSFGHIEYSEVVERNGDGSFSIYKYTCYGDGHVDEPPLATLFDTPSIYEPYCTKDQERGLLKSKYEYNSSGELNLIQSYLYEKSDYDTINLYKTIPLTLCDISSFEGSVCNSYTYTMRPATITTHQYEPGSSFPLSNIVTYRYNSNGLPQSVSTTRSDGYIEQTATKYADSFVSTSGIYAQMVANNRLSAPVEQSTCIMSGNDVIRTIKRTRYNYTSNPVFPSSVDVAYGDGAFQQQASYLYDNYYNVLELSQRNAPTKCYIWGYKGTRLLAELQDTPYGFITSVLGSALVYSAAPKPDLSRLAYIRNHQTCGQMTTYEYDNRGLITTVTYPNGTKRYYFYDYLGRLTMIIDSDGNILETFEYNYAH